ncbi:MAG: hypothetical protein PHU61_02520 [Candidatus Absconditabacteria bacterium]|nr:hypothetical protein [Candidatus Absconditabacteria bacterium]MDD3868152.1 hypothetical protein [Candidatus Absconditabacteria bacterium]MDD4714538.1 hypothetical protein [Candidatus Absconditabacteria bacterium]
MQRSEMNNPDSIHWILRFTQDDTKLSFGMQRRIPSTDSGLPRFARNDNEESR